MQIIEDMRKSIFCLVLPGDSASARRTTEIFMSGCIPVFLGPPYGSMPFAKAVDYRSSSYVINVTQHGCAPLTCTSFNDDHCEVCSNIWRRVLLKCLCTKGAHCQNQVCKLPMSSVQMWLQISAALCAALLDCSFVLNCLRHTFVMCVTACMGRSRLSCASST